MKRFLIVLVLLLTASIARAATYQVEFDGSAAATSYDIQVSTDNGATWLVQQTIAASNCPNNHCIVNLTPPLPSLIFIRVTASNAQGTSVRYNSGFWFCDSCGPPPSPVVIKVQ